MKNKCTQCGRHWFGYELRGVLAILVVLLTFGLAYVQLLRGEPSETLIPPWANGILSSVLTFYFMSRSAERMRAMSQERDQNAREASKESKE
jgi:hypothetical protein